MPPLPGFLHTPPDDWEFYLQGRIESEEPVRVHKADVEWLRQMGLDQLLGPGAWDSYGGPITLSQAEILPEELYNEDISEAGFETSEQTEDLGLIGSSSESSQVHEE